MEVCFEQPVPTNNIECAQVTISKQVIQVDSISTMQKPIQVPLKVEPSGGMSDSLLDNFSIFFSPMLEYISFLLREH